MKVLVYILLFIALNVDANKPWKQPTSDPPKKWDSPDRIEDLLAKSRVEIYRLSGSIELLKKMANKLTKNASSLHMKVIVDRVAQWVGCPVTEAEVDQAKAIFSIGNIFLGLGVFLLFLAAIALTVCYCDNCLKNFSDDARVLILYALSVALLYYAYYKGYYVKGFLCVLGALLLTVAYIYHLYMLRASTPKSIALLSVPPTIVWGFLAILFESQIIGFGTVIAFGFTIGATEVNEKLSQSFQRQAWEVMLPLGPAAVVLTLYVLYGLGLFAAIGSYIELFSSSFFFTGGLTYFMMLLVRSSEHFHFENYRAANMMIIISTLLIVLLGFVSSGLAVFRTLAFFVTIAYLALKFTEIPWGNCWGGGLLGGGALLFGVGMCLQAYWRFLFPETSHNF